MDIHEIIHAWENSALPNSLDALAAIQNKVDDYNDKAKKGYVATNSPMVAEMYEQQVIIYTLITSDLEGITDSLIGKKPAAAVEPSKQADMSDWVKEGGAAQ